MRFTLLHHTGYGREHYDFLLERPDQERLTAWKIFSADWTSPQTAVRNFDHRTLYLDYEGEIDGGRGRVTRRDTGTYETQTWTGKEIIIFLHGAKISGIVSLSRQSDTEGQDSIWLLKQGLPPT